MEKIKILWVYSGIMAFGGMEAFIVSHLHGLNKDVFSIDIVQQGEGQGVYDEELQKMGCHLYYVRTSWHSFKKYKQDFYQIFKNGYSIIHTHADHLGYPPLKLAKEYGIPIRIAHSHNTKLVSCDGKVKLSSRFLCYLFKFGIRRVATHFMACSEEAGLFLFGKRQIHKNNFLVLNNSIELEKFIFNASKREKLRSFYNIEQKIVVGCVARLDDNQKNQSFLLELFQNEDLNKTNRILVLIGDGPDKEKFEKFALQHNIKNILFIPAQKSINDFYNMFDIFVLPSHFEGFGIVILEASANGLPCIISNNLPKEVKSLPGVKSIPTDVGHQNEWISEVLKDPKRHDNIAELSAMGFSISTSCETLSSFYFSLLAKNNSLNH